MTAFKVDQFLRAFFQANDCIIYEHHDGFIDVRLTEKLDRAIMNRPFYWHYVKQTGRQGEPFRLKLITNIDNEAKDGEWIHVGTPRMNEIVGYLEENSRFIQQFEQIHASKQTMLQPWLVVNVMITFKGRQMRQELKSIGVNLINGLFLLNAMENLEKTKLSSFIKENCFTISPIISVTSGFLRIERKLIDDLVDMDEHWAIESIRQMKDELLLLYHFYDAENDRGKMMKEALEIVERLMPKIEFHVINGGLFYLSESWNRMKV